MLGRLARDATLGKVDHTVQVTSFGGSGTTTLLEHLVRHRADVPRTPGSFPFKHQRVPPPPTEVPPGFRVVYPFGDPRDVVGSVFRREFQGGHYRGMRLQKPSPAGERHLVDLDAFLANGVDEFGVADHFARWRGRDDRAYPVLFVRFVDLADVWSDVRDLAGLPRSTPPPELRPRASAWERLPSPQRARIDDMFGSLAAELAALPPAEIA
jgi:hypothetical protein